MQCYYNLYIMCTGTERTRQGPPNCEGQTGFTLALLLFLYRHDVGVRKLKRNKDYKLHVTFLQNHC
jgi:hypothetical protein